MEQNIRIRNERPEDYETVERITREAFYNLYVPGCVEHYLVHLMRTHEDFIPELDFVLELDGAVIGDIMYTKATLTDEEGQSKRSSPSDMSVSCRLISERAMESFLWNIPFEKPLRWGMMRL